MKRVIAALFVAIFSVAQASSALAPVSISPERAGHTATRLNSGLVLVTGGVNENATLSSALLYDPVLGTFTPTGNMRTARANHTATLLNDGRVLIAGGDLGNGLAAKTAELYDPVTGQFALISKKMTANNGPATSSTCS